MGAEIWITLFAVLVALFGNSFWSWWNRPKIKFSFENNLPYVVQGLRDGISIVFYFRARITNKGNTVAKNCRAKVISVIPENKEQLSSLSFEPDNLKWSSAPREMRYRIDPNKNINQVDINQLVPIHRESMDISPNGGWEFCDLFEICNGFVTFVSSGLRPSLSCYEGFIVTVEFFGDNIHPRRIQFRISPSKDFLMVNIKNIKRIKH
ncbi:MAG: hypothetical protein OQK82_02180 [Candidatus Pacearchaeota archaeon]|nr:hypothetical protein [Candidatus Pacearchaeota archaeon]